MGRGAAVMLMVLGATLACAGPVSSSHAFCHGSVTGILVVDNAPTMWLEDRGQGGLWLYREANGLAGLQRGGQIGHVVTDPCVEASPPDELVAHVPSA